MQREFRTVCCPVLWCVHMGTLLSLWVNQRMPLLRFSSSGFRELFLSRYSDLDFVELHFENIDCKKHRMNKVVLNWPFGRNTYRQTWCNGYCSTIWQTVRSPGLPLWLEVRSTDTLVNSLRYHKPTQSLWSCCWTCLPLVWAKYLMPRSIKNTTFLFSPCLVTDVNVYVCVGVGEGMLFLTLLLACFKSLWCFSLCV